MLNLLVRITDEGMVDIYIGGKEASFHLIHTLVEGMDNDGTVDTILMSNHLLNTISLGDYTSMEKETILWIRSQDDLCGDGHAILP